MSGKPDDAARIAGLASILQSGNRQKEIPPSPAPAAAAMVAEATPPQASPRSRKQPIGKNRDPNYHQCGLYIRKTTHKKARRRLEDTQPGKDLSELVQELLEQWLASQ